MKAIIFDLDGTLLNTIEDIANATNAALRIHGFPTHPVKDYCYMVGNGFPTLVTRAVPQDIRPTLASDKIATIVQDARGYYMQHPCDYTVAYPGITMMLDTLAQKGFLLGVLSNKMDDLTKLLIKRNFPDIPFVQVLGSRPNMPMKPDPAVLNGMLEEFACSPQDCLYVGDSNVDVATAHAANTKVVGVAWGFRGRQELEESGADYIIEQASDLLTIVDAA